MTGEQLHAALSSAGVYERLPSRREKLGEPFMALDHDLRDALDLAAESVGATFPAPVTSPVDPPKVSGTEVTRNV